MVVRLQIHYRFHILMHTLAYILTYIYSHTHSLTHTHSLSHTHFKVVSEIAELNDGRAVEGEDYLLVSPR